MTIEDLQHICNQLPGVIEDIKWENHLCFNVGEKMFLITSPDNYPPTASFKVPAEEFEEIIAREGFSPAQYLARYKWVALDDIGRINQKEWEHFIRQSYIMVSKKLPSKKKNELGITDL